MVYSQRRDEFYTICQQITSHRQKIAKPKIEQLIQQRVDINTSNPDLLSHILAESLLKRIDRNLLESKNIYVEEFDIPQIVMFYKMSKAYPHVAVSHTIANQYIFDAIKELDEVTIFDIGIGKGLQVQKLISSLVWNSASLKKINIIGLDPSEVNLTDSKEAFETLQKAVPIQLNYYTLNKLVENLDEKDYKFIKDISGDKLVINSAFTIHHSYHDVNDYDKRTEIFHNLKKLNPLILTLIEPNSNHDTEDLSRRFYYCWEHFGSVFQLIDESDLQPSEKFSIKEKFFGREIRDIFGISDSFRCERHEPYESWILKLARAGFTPYNLKDISVHLPKHSGVIVTEGMTRLNYNDMTLIAVLAYKGDN